MTSAPGIGATHTKRLNPTRNTLQNLKYTPRTKCEANDHTKVGIAVKMKFFYFFVSSFLLTFDDVVAQLDGVRKFQNIGLTLCFNQPLTTIGLTQRTFCAASSQSDQNAPPCKQTPMRGYHL
jgi:hypothetical protein